MNSVTDNLHLSRAIGAANARREFKKYGDIFTVCRNIVSEDAQLVGGPYSIEDAISRLSQYAAEEKLGMRIVVLAALRKSER